MNKRNMQQIIEAILFSSGEPVSAHEIAAALDTDDNEVIKAITLLSNKYDIDERGIRIIRIDDAYQMCSREDYYDHIVKICEPRRQAPLSSAALETLSIIAYNQPITKSKIEQIRGVDSSGSVFRLVERGLIEEAGRLDTPGRPILYATTKEFLRCFGLNSLSDLPDLGLI
jgi:segregation and condensation protein B